MQLQDLDREIRNILRDPTIESHITTWLNAAMYELAGQFEIPALRLMTPATLAVVNTNWLYNVVTTPTHASGYVFHKIVFRVASATTTRGFFLGDTLSALDALDYLHVTTGTTVTRVAIEGNMLGTYPMANDSLRLWFYRQPIDMVAPTDEPDGMSDEFRYRVLVPMVVLKAFRVFPQLINEAGQGSNEVQTLAWWELRLRQGLIGDGAQTGWLDFLHKRSPLAGRPPYLHYQYSRVPAVAGERR